MTIVEPRRIVSARHPECLHNVAHQEAIERGIVNRQSPLTPVGELQRDITAEYVRKAFDTPDAIFCSTYMRTRAIPVAAGFADVLVESQLLDERNMGVWHTATRSEVLRMYPEEDERMKGVGYHAYQPPEGESCVEVERRLVAFLESDAIRRAGDTIFLSAHGISGLCLWRLLTKASVDEWWARERLKNASISVYERSANGYECTSWNIAPWEGKIDPALMTKRSVEA